MSRRHTALCAANIALASLLAGCASADSQPGAAPICAGRDGWDDGAPPQRLFGNVWFVGTCGVSAVLITSRRGHILIDGTTASSAGRVADNISAAGFRLEDVKLILVSHAHHDHVGGVQALRQRSGATVVSRGDDADALERGRGTRSDPQFDLPGAFPAIPNVRRVAPGETLRLGDLSVQAHATPGHTPGSTSWSWRSCERSRCLDIVYADSLTAISDDSFRYGDDAAHPGVLEGFRHSIETVRDLRCDILLTPHPASSRMWERISAGGRQQLIDNGACRRYAEFASRALDARLARERAR